MTTATLTIRLAALEDGPALAMLCAQLGYPTSPQAVQQRLQHIHGLSDHAVYVAKHPEAGVIGWVHVYVTDLLETDRQAEIGGLVVSEVHRQTGAGKLLMQYAEQWARTQACAAVCLRSNIIREGAHAFYRKIGYREIKRQLTFRKLLSETTAGQATG